MERVFRLGDNNSGRSGCLIRPASFTLNDGSTSWSRGDTPSLNSEEMLLGEKTMNSATLREPGEHMPHVPCRMEYRVENNPFVSLGVDLTYRCNMSCTFCYNPIRSMADMELSYFEEVCRRLPKSVQFKFLGGEPTLHPDLLGFIRAARSRQHEVTILSNGRRYTDPAFVTSLAELNRDARFILGLSMDGGSSRDDVYYRINNEHCRNWKLKALETLDQHFPGRVEISAIIVRGLNEGVVPELLALAARYPRIVRYIHFRTAAKAGRWDEMVPYTLEELKEVVRPHFTTEQFQPQCLWEPHCDSMQGCGACYRFRPTPRLQVSLIEFATPRAASCSKRGKLVDGAFLVQSFFENIMHNSETLMAGVDGRPAVERLPDAREQAFRRTAVLDIVLPQNFHQRGFLHLNAVAQRREKREHDGDKTEPVAERQCHPDKQQQKAGVGRVSDQAEKTRSNESVVTMDRYARGEKTS